MGLWTGISKRIYGDDVVKEAFLRPDVWINAPAIHKNLEIFMKYYDISYVLSSPCNPVSAACKYVWLENHGIDPQKLILAMNKETISRDGTMLIDDNPKHCVSFMNGGGKSVMFIRPWSNGQSFDKKVIDTAMELSVTSSEELLDAIKSLL